MEFRPNSCQNLVQRVKECLRSCKETFAHIINQCEISTHFSHAQDWILDIWSMEQHKWDNIGATIIIYILSGKLTSKQSCLVEIYYK